MTLDGSQSQREEISWPKMGILKWPLTPLEMNSGDGASLPNSRVENLDLMSALLELDEADRQIVVLHVVAGFKHREIADFLSLPHSTVRWRYRRALSKLAAILGGE